MSWTGNFYSEVLSETSVDFKLVENDYCHGHHKFAGNAQAVSRDRFIHHTSFLWRYNSENMKTLQLPDKRPDYREDRSHDDFLCTMDGFLDSVNRFLSCFQHLYPNMIIVVCWVS